MMNLTENLLKSRLVTNQDRTTLGFISHCFQAGYAQMWGFKNTDGLNTLFTTPIEVRSIKDVEGPEDLLKIRENTLASIERQKTELAAKESKLPTRETMLVRVSKKRVKNSSKPIEKLIEETKEYEESIKYGSIVSIKNNKVGIPSRCCPSFYLTNDDLNQFNIGDIVSVEFGNGKVAPKYRNRTVQFVVNNYMKHNWRRMTKRLALIPLEDRWTLDDVLILDDYDRFDCLMIDLFPCNRIPFNGWKSKEVKIKKNGEIGQIPKTGSKKPTSGMLNRKGPEEILLSKITLYGDKVCKGGIVVNDVGKRKDMGESFVFIYKIYTSRDKKDAIKFLEEAIIDLKKNIEELKESIKNCLAFVAGIKFIEDLNYFEKKIRG